MPKIKNKEKFGLKELFVGLGIILFSLLGMFVNLSTASFPEWVRIIEMAFLIPASIFYAFNFVEYSNFITHN